MTLLKQITLFTTLFLWSYTSINAQEKSLKIQGLITDETKYSIAYASVSIPAKFIGTTSDEDGVFYLKLSQNNLLDTLEISTIGFKTYRTIVKDFIALKDKTIVLKEDVVSLDEVRILTPSEYVELAFKNLKNNTVSYTHELKILNRFFAIEEADAKFFVEQYVKVKDKGPSKNGRISEVKRIEVLEGRKSVDYRTFKDADASRKIYPIDFMLRIDPLRRGISISDYKWTKEGYSSYDGEDIIILKGKHKTKKRQGYLDPVLYVGVDSYKVYKTTNTANNVLFLYKKNKDGKLYLSYHNNYTRRFRKLNPSQQKFMRTSKEKIRIATRSEIIVLDIETDKDKIHTKYTDVYGKGIDKVDVKYNSEFWRNFEAHPTEYYKKCVKQLESVYGVPLETQFNLANK